MKKLKYTLIALLVLCMTGCNESSFLEEDPRASLYPENLLVDYSGFQSMVTSLYGMMRNEYRRADALGGGLPLVLHSAWGCGVDNSWSNNSHSDFKYMYYPSQINQTDLQIFQNIFQWCYRIINTANMVISRAEGSGIDWKGTETEAAAHKNKIIAQARFFRAWAYRHLTYSFGAVPLSTEEITGMNYRNDWERNSVESIREVMEQDFAFAMNNLPLREENNSKISGAMARHYLGELYLAMDQPSTGRRFRIQFDNQPFRQELRQSGLSVHRRIPHTDVCGRKHGGFIRFCQHGTGKQCFRYSRGLYEEYI